VQIELHSRLTNFQAFDPAPGEYNRSMRNDIEIGSLNPKPAEIREAKYAPGPRIGTHIPGKPTHHSLSVGQKRKHRRWRAVDSCFAPYLAARPRFRTNFNIRVFLGPRNEIDRLISGPQLSGTMLCSRHVASTMADNRSTCKTSSEIVA